MMKKKLLSLALAAMMTLSLAACGSGGASSGAASASAGSASASSSTAASSGVKVGVSMAFLSAVAALVVTARFNSAAPSAGNSYEMDAIGACFIGGASAYGGTGTVGGAVIGAVFMEDYLRQNKYIGALVGRHANRIGGSAFTLDGKAYPLLANDGPNHLHGGGVGFDEQLWKLEDASDTQVVLSLVSPDMAKPDVPAMPLTVPVIKSIRKSPFRSAELNQLCTGLELSANCDEYAGNGARTGSHNLVFHLHSLKSHQHLTGGNRVTLLDDNAHHLARHRSGNGAGTGRSSGSSVGGSCRRSGGSGGCGRSGHGSHALNAGGCGGSCGAVLGDLNVIGLSIDSDCISSHARASFSFLFSSIASTRPWTRVSY